MFDFLQSDNKPKFEITGITIANCEYTSLLRDDLRLLLSQNDDVDCACKQILNYYVVNIRNYLSTYEYSYYLPITYISLAYYLAKHGYYHEETFKKAIEYIDNESTIFPWEDAVYYQKIGVNALNEVLLSEFGERAREIASLLSDAPNNDDYPLQSANVPNIINQILFLDGSAQFKLNKRRKELQKVKELLTLPLAPIKKPVASSVLYKISGYKFSTSFAEGDVIAYEIKQGKNAGKYAIFIVDYIREIRRLLCDFSRFVEKWEYLALVDGLYDEIPTKIPNKFLSTGVLTDFDGNEFYFNHFYVCENNQDFYFKKVSSVTPPRLKRSDFICNFFKPQEEVLAKEINVNNIDEILNDLFK